jgi:hypothetical protein
MIDATGAAPTALPSMPRRSWLAIWMMALSRPTVQNFSMLLQDPNIGTARALKWVGASALVGSLIAWAISPGFIRVDAVNGLVTWSIGLDFVVLSTVVAFIADFLIMHIMAKAFGGHGSLRQIAFVCAAYTAPMILLLGVLQGAQNALFPIYTQPATPGVEVTSWVGSSFSFLTIVIWLVWLVRAAFDATAVRAVYGISLPRAVVPPLIFIAVMVGATLCFSIIT